MKLAEEDVLLIERYFEDALSDEERRLFDEKLNKSETFADQVTAQRTMLTAIRRAEDSSFRNKLKHKAQQFTIPERSRKFRWYHGVAASLIIVVSAIFLLPSYESIFEDSFKPLLEQPVKRGESLEENQYKAAMQTYSLGDYQKAFDLFDKISASDLIHEAELYQGNCQLILGNAEHAIQYFIKARNSNNQWITINAEWFLALAFIKQHDKTKAVELLTLIAEKDGPFQEKSIGLLQKLKWSFY